MTAYWCEHAWLGGLQAEPGVLITLDGERIDTVQSGVAAPPAGAHALRGLVLPGFANAHSHAFQRALRGRTHRARGSFWTWREQMYALVTALTPESMLALARAAFAEMVLAGITVVGEFHYVHHRAEGPYRDPNAMGEAVIEAAREAGLRITVLDACYLHGGIDTAATGAQLRFRDADAQAWAARVDALAPAEHARIGAAIHSLRAVDPRSAELIAEWARERSAPLHVHVSEQPAENEACLARYGLTPTALLERCGALAAHCTAVHATHLTAEDVELLGGAAACCCLCPTTERDLADGVGGARTLVDAGATLALGSDSNAIIEPLEEARAVELDERLASLERGRHGADELLYAATAGGYASLGWPEGGMLRAGALGDLVAVDVDGVRLAGTRPEELVDAVVFAGAAADVREVVVGGRLVVSGGAHTVLDVPRELRAAIALVSS